MRGYEGSLIVKGLEDVGGWVRWQLRASFSQNNQTPT